ncbi:hypothetical protein LRP49_01715 [Enterovibrio sp. ZSDZ35]|uniref:Uncharacterized protein n=1 Tax=Enterovibrio qingdaonensis TaxID=2899818 RepID=A0ABT5QG28_9GAMM|nr:hypothetical protein [Enterovibrio sp. ZSDZ35]MDD1779902.1 hypothetical protein [Enterovibrio sp. ZSDZ35]
MDAQLWLTIQVTPNDLTPSAPVVAEGVLVKNLKSEQMELLLFLGFIYFSSTPTYAGFFGFKEVDGELSHTPFTKTMGFLGILFAGFLATLYFLGDYNHEQEIGHILGTLAFFAFGVVMLLETFFSEGKYDENSIDYKTIWKGRKVIKWEELISYKNKGDQIRLDFKDGTTIKVYLLMGGYGYLLDFLARKFPQM